MLDILIVEDEFYTLEALEKMVLDSGLDCRVIGKAYDGEEALEMLREQVPSLVITDIRMPNMDGLELARYLSEHYPQVDVVMISGYSDFQYAQQGIRYRVFDYLLKPLKRDQLTQVIQQVMEKQAKGQLTLKHSWEPRVIDSFQELVRVVQLLEREKVESALGHLWTELTESQQLDWGAQLQAGISLLETLESRFPAEQGMHLGANFSRLVLAKGGEVGDRSLITRHLVAQIMLLIDALDKSRQSLGSDVLQRVLQYVDTNYHREIGLQDVAEIAFLNPSYFSEKFKELTGENFSGYLTRVRIEKAKELLTDGRIKVYEVAQMVGYTDQAYFSRVFKKHVGYNPAEYRKRLGIA